MKTHVNVELKPSSLQLKSNIPLGAGENILLFISLSKNFRVYSSLLRMGHEQSLFVKAFTLKQT